MTTTTRATTMATMRTADRLIVAAVGVYNLYFAYFVATGPTTAGVPLERAWAVVFAVAGVACLALEAAFTNRDILALSGAATVVAYASRAVLLLLGVALGSASLDEARVQAGVAVWATLATLVAYVWLRVLRPLTELRRRER